MNERLVPELAAAVLDGKPIDWPCAESSADEAARPLLAELKVLAALADVHRHQPPDDNALPVAAANDALTHWGHLRALERIGCGAFGEVYRAWDTRLDREVALKLIDAEPVVGDDDSSSSFIHEGRLLARVRHPNVVTIYGAEQIGARIGLWMEFVRGRTLKQIVDDGKPFSGAEAVRIGIDVARAVAAVHGAGMLHRDIKAQNVMLADDGRAVLMDFGTGREVADDRSDLAGTPLYLAPEILAGGEATVESDIYSLGVLLYYLVTGSYPVRAETINDIRLAHQRNERAPIRTPEGRREVPPKLARIIERAIDPRPAGRHASADALAADLAAFARRPALTVPRAIGAAAMLLLIAGLAWEAVGRTVGSSRTPARLFAGVAGQNAAAGPVIPSPPIIAVLPFKNLSEALNDVFVDGLTEEIIRGLSVVQGLQVRSRASSFAFKDGPRTPADVARRLDVNLVVDGSVLRSGKRLRVNAQLIHVAAGVPLWSESFDRELKDVFAVQSDILRAIVNNLRLTLGSEHREYETDLEARELYLKGSAVIPRRADNFKEATELFQEVLAKDPGFAAPHARLAIAQGRAALAGASEAMGWMHARELDWSSAEKAFRRAIDLDPSLTEPYTSYSFSTLRPLGKRDDALRLLREALKHNPLSLQVQSEIGHVLLEDGQYEQAVRTFKYVSTVEPGYPYVDTFLATALVFAGKPAEALPVFERARPRGPRVLGQRPRKDPRTVLAYIALGMRAEAEALVAEHLVDATPSTLALMYTALGDKERAFEALERTARDNPQRVPILLVYPEMAALRGDPRLAALRERFRLPPQ